MAEIAPADGGAVRVDLERDEARLLGHLLDEMRTLLEADVPRVDPVVKRLFPDAHEDEQEAQAYRELVDDQLHSAKLDAVKAVQEGLPQATKRGLSLGADEVDMWLTTLTDIRLAIGTRLDVTEEKMAAEPDADDPEASALAVLHWLGWLQEMMVQATMDL